VREKINAINNKYIIPNLKINKQTSNSGDQIEHFVTCTLGAKKKFT
jgi:hypothetical protein